MKIEAKAFLLFTFAQAAALAAAAPLHLPFEKTRIVLGDDVTARFAATELNEIVKKATGKTFAVGDDAAAVHRIYIGRSAAVDRALGAGNLDSLGTEGSLVTAKGDDLYLVGADAAGTLWSVYDFVEDNLGYRWYQLCRDDRRAEREIVERTDTVTFGGVETRRKPGFDGYRIDHENMGYFRRFRLRHRSNGEIENFVPGYRFKYRKPTWGHGFDLFLPRRTDIPWLKLDRVPPQVRALAPAFEKHPEFFSLDASGKRSDQMQLCLSSKATRDAVWRSLKWWYEKNGPGVYMVGSNDEHTGPYCFCDGCRALEKKYGVPCGAMWECVIDMCNRLKAAKVDDVYITSLAYRRQTQICPPGVVFPGNFICDFAPVTWDRALSEAQNEVRADGFVYNYLKNAQAWGKACPGGLSYWYYGTSICGYTWGRLAREIREIYDAGIRSAGLCGSEGGNEFGDLMHHMWFWTLYNPTGDVRAEFGRACESKFGPAWRDILAYTDLLEKIRRRGVARTPVGPGGIDMFIYATDGELAEMDRILAAAADRVKGTRFAENTAWARVSLDVEKSFRHGDRAAEERARTAAKGFFDKVGGPLMMCRVDRITRRLDEMANYKFLKSDELPEPLRKYPRGKVKRILPAKSAPYSTSRIRHGRMWSEPDPSAVCGFAITDALPDAYAPRGAKDLRIGLYNHMAGKYLIHFEDVKIPADFWKKDTYRLLRLGVSRYAPRTWLVWTDVKGSTHLSSSPLDTALLSRLYDPIQTDKLFETWISVKAQGPKFFPGDTRENRVFIEQLFSVECP